MSISKEKQDRLNKKMDSLGVREDDIQESFVRSGGHGGQKINTTSSCVYLKHIQTGIEVKCQKERSQSLNRFFARRILLNKIEAMVKGRESQEQKRIEKIRRQKSRRSKRAKEKILHDKKMQSKKKEERSYNPEDDI